MSSDTNTTAHGHDHDEHGGASHGTFRSYMTGFILSVILTAIPFWIVMSDAIANHTIAALTILGFALVQVIVHMIYFLHMDTKSEGGWNMLALIFTIILLVIAVSGSIWVMYHLDTNMMPMTPVEASNLP
ncbi:cytochrome o ubiquinol oxidase subunit IV [Stakelama sediminis]|uniref:Cytochrome bo(3) ubiquinol oxidase subunit 4 n=1 Tax=Stakelama sediminis TaxID=463200 RepID=A0A840Z109_9SPHN|nr:cytochrome o ubiquinol oxidase subunit IV [Stakelama sediminis]MBB5719467.1 cytochrome o ubiquinol oxidase operon protein cyoD [Stakelama sediminis]